MPRLVICFVIALLSACSTLPSGIADKLSPCASAPNCVSSFSLGSQHIAAFNVASDRQWQLLQDILLAMPRTNVVTRDALYLHAVSHSAIMRFRDDIELRYNPNEHRVDVRSAARLGYYDFEVNRKRIETLRDRFRTAQDH